MLLLFAASAAVAQNAARLPDAQDVAAAHQAHIERMCQALIDQCEILPLPAEPRDIEALTCSARATTATCTFQLRGWRCTTRFILDRSEGRRRWIVERRPPRFYGHPQVDCRD